MPTGTAAVAQKPLRPIDQSRRRPVHGGNPMLAFRRFKWVQIEERGEDAVLGSEIGRMYAARVLTAREASAAAAYAAITARYDKYHTLSGRTAKSPAYEYSTGQDDEIARRARDGSIEDYEYRARQAKKLWERLHAPIRGCVPAGARNVIDEVCLYNRAISSLHHADFKRVMARIAEAFRIEPGAQAQEPAQEPTSAQRVRRAWTQNETRARDAVNTLDRWFRDQGATVSGYRLSASESECGIEGFGLSRSAAPLRHAVLISRGKALPEHLHALLDKAAAAKGWVVK